MLSRYIFILLFISCTSLALPLRSRSYDAGLAVRNTLSDYSRRAADAVQEPFQRGGVTGTIGLGDNQDLCVTSLWDAT